MFVTAIRDLKKNSGSTRSHILECDDGRSYLVKFKDKTRAVINEHVGYSIAAYLQLPVPEFRHVFVPQELIDSSDDLRIRGISEGIHHGSLWLDRCVDFSRVAFSGELHLANAACIPGSIVLDNLILNWDRNNYTNYLVHTTDSGLLEYRIVDFDEILGGPAWTLKTMSLVKTTTTGLVPLFPIMALYVQGLSSFSPWLERAEKISKDVVDQVLSDVPSFWEVSEEEKVVISDLIVTRSGTIRGILLANRARFPNWRDGGG